MGVLFAGCGQGVEGISLQIERQYLGEITNLKIWVITPQISDKTINCKDLLDKKIAFEPSKFITEDKKDLIPDSSEKQDVEFKDLKIGSKLFVAAGYAQTTAENTPLLLGCQEANIERGVKIFISLFLARYQT
jgi:hypothetical protein